MKTIAVIDIGTNSIRLGVHKIGKNHEYTTLALHKEVVRLGQGEFAHNRITRAALEHGLLVTRKFADIARRYGAQEIVAVATSAIREAENRDEFVERAKTECGVNVRVISGMEEARLIYLGVVSGVEINSHEALFIDIGGGSTELIVGNARDYDYLESIKLGAIRLADMFLKNKDGKLNKKTYRTMTDYVRGAANHAFRKLRDYNFDIAFGSSGTIINLAEITARRLNSEVANIRNYCLKYDDLCETLNILAGMTLSERRNVPGINPERADIIVSGGAILEAIMSGACVDKIYISDRALRDGILIDYIFQEERVRNEFLSTSPRLRSVAQLCKSCGYEEAHAQKTTDLACSIFRQLRKLNLHSYGDAEEELLRYSAMLHDVGTFISYQDHHKHSYYIVRNWNLLGFSDEEIEILATISMCHRKAPPQKVAVRKFNASIMRMIDVLASILRIADALDRTQVGLVKRVECHLDSESKCLNIDVFAHEDCPLEIWWLDNKKKLFEQTFGLKIVPNLIIENE